MKAWRGPILIAHLVVVSMILAACGGTPTGPNWGGGSSSGSGGSGGSGGTSGTLPISFLVSSAPSSIPANISVLSFSVNISKITLTSQATGKTFDFTPTNPVLDLNKQLSDSAYLGTGTFPDDAYSGVQLSISSSRLVYCTSTLGVPGCNAGAIQTVTGGTAVVPFNFSQPTLGPSATGIGVRFGFHMGNVIVLNSGGTAVQSIDFVNTLAALGESLPSATNLGTGQLDYIEDLTGVVTSVGASTIKLQTAFAGTITADVAPTSNFAIPPCANNDISCVQVGQVADMDAILNADGTFTLVLFDPIDSTSNDWVEGVVGYAPTSASQFQLVVSNFVPATTGSKIGTSLLLGDPVTVNISSGVSFAIDGKNLSVPANSFAGAQDTSALFPGQVVAVRASSFTAASGATPASLTADTLTLRFSRLSGNPSTAGPNFQFLPAGPYLGIQNVATTYETTGVTNYDLASPGSSVTANQLVGIRALYLGPNIGFTIAKVRQ
jgi:hypothetical protein